MIRVLLADDHELVRTGLARMLYDVANIEVVGEAENGEDAVKLTRRLEPNVVLMDVIMPGIGGLEATRRICQSTPEAKVIVVTSVDDDIYPARLLQAGAAGYVTKGADLDEMVKAIQQVSRGQRYISPDIAQKLALRSFSGESDRSPFDELSERELQITLMVVNCQKVNEIAESLHLSPKTVNTYRYRIFNKLDINSDVELTLLAVRHGLVEQNIISG